MLALKLAKSEAPGRWLPSAASHGIVPVWQELLFEFVYHCVGRAVIARCQSLKHICLLVWLIRFAVPNETFPKSPQPLYKGVNQAFIKGLSEREKWASLMRPDYRE
jgi:hypothetical protein